MVLDCRRVRHISMIDDPLSLITFGVWLMAAGMYPLGFLFGACSPCCEPPCGFALSFERCMRITRVGNPTPGKRGTHVRVLLLGSRDTGAFQVASGGGSNFERALSVGNSPKEVVVPIRVTLSASGSSRTPSGQTRSQVWRFNATPPSINGVASTADIAGPPWYLQVDVNVTGITTVDDIVAEYSQYGGTVDEIREALAGDQAALAVFNARVAAAETPSATHAMATDQHGQAKLVWNIKQGGEAITAETNVTLSLVGFQRWELADTVVITSSLNATLASGASVTGWLVNKASGLTVTSRAFVVRIRGHFGQRGFDVAHYLFDDQGALDFLNGDTAARVLISDGQAGAPFEADYELLPDSTLCGVDINSLRIGIALGVYPTIISRSLGSRIVPYYDPNTGITSDTIDLDGSECGNQYPQYPSILTQNSLVNLNKWGATALPDHFWDGESLLWAIENQPYRTSFTIGDPYSFENPATYHLNIMSPLFWYGAIVIGEASINLRATLRYVGEDPDPSQDPPRCSPCDVTVENVASESKQYVPFLDDSQFPFFFFTSGTPLGVGGFYRLQFRSSVPAQFPEFRFTSPTAYLQCFGGQVVVTAPFNAFGGQSYQNSEQRVPGNTLLPQRGTLFITNLSVEITQPPYTNVQYEPANFSPATLDYWSPVGAGGGTSTLTRANGTPTTTTTTIPPNTGLLPIYQQPSQFGAANGFVQPGAACSLVGLISIDEQVQAEPTVVSSPQSVSLSQGDCRYYAPRFTGSTSRFVGASSFVSCNGCQPTLQVISGSENASVRIVPSGDRSGAIEVISLRDWPSGQGVEFSVTCGNDVVTHIIRAPA